MQGFLRRQIRYPGSFLAPGKKLYWKANRDISTFSKTLKVQIMMWGVDGHFLIDYLADPFSNPLYFFRLTLGSYFVIQLSLMMTNMVQLLHCFFTFSIPFGKKIKKAQIWRCHKSPNWQGNLCPATRFTITTLETGFQST